MRLTIEQLRAGSAAGKAAIGEYFHMPVAMIPYYWKNDGGEVAGCCPAQAMWLLATGRSLAESPQFEYDTFLEILSPSPNSRGAVFNDMCQIVGYAGRHPLGAIGASQKMILPEFLAVLDGIIAAADLTEKRALEAKARAEEFNVPVEEGVMV